jgi:GNAT superfamily N-acetyltransferase
VTRAEPARAVEARIRAYEPWMREAIVDVVRSVHDEYGFTWDFAGYHRDLYDIERYYLAPGGMFWALSVGERIVGCVGVTPHGQECELHRLYLRREARGGGMGQRMLDTALDWARQRGFRKMVAWSDVKLGLAHKLYLTNGFVLFGQRLCDDPDQSIEHGFRKEPL